MYWLIIVKNLFEYILFMTNIYFFFKIKKLKRVLLSIKVGSIYLFSLSRPYSGRRYLVADNHRTAPYGLYGVMKSLTSTR